MTRDAELVEELRYVIDEGRWAADEAQGGRVVNKRRKVRPSDSPSSSGPGRIGRLARDGHPQLDELPSGERTPLAFEREIAGCARAVQQPNLPVRRAQGVTQHGAQRRDPCAAGDEEKAPFLGVGRKREVAEGPFDVGERPCLKGEMGPGAALLVDSHQQFQPAITLRVLRCGSNRIRPPGFVAVGGNQERLAGLVGKPGAAKVKADDPRSGCGRQNLEDRQGQQHDALCYPSVITLARVTAREGLLHMLRTTRRVRGLVIRIVRRRALATVLGLALILPALCVELSGSLVPWWGSGLGFVLGATGAALLWAGIAGLGPDWIDKGP